MTTPPDIDAIVERAVLAERGYTVKTLEWGPYPNPVFAGPDVAVAVIEVFGRMNYQAQRDPWAPDFMVYLAPEFGTAFWQSKGHETIEDAKKAAQADYEARILSALAHHPTPSSPSEQGAA